MVGCDRVARRLGAPGRQRGGGSALEMQSLTFVQGTITTRDVLVHTVTILRLWGPGFYARCLLAIASGRRCTFLEVLASQVR
jgi:hypothetical protein